MLQVTRSRCFRLSHGESPAGKELEGVLKECLELSRHGRVDCHLQPELGACRLTKINGQ